MTRDNVIPLHRGHPTPAEQTFDRDLRAERDRLSEQYDRRPDYPVGARFEEEAPEPRMLFTADELIFALFFGVFLGAMLTAVAAYVWSFWL